MTTKPLDYLKLIVVPTITFVILGTNLTIIGLASNSKKSSSVVNTVKTVRLQPAEVFVRDNASIFKDLHLTKVIYRVRPDDNYLAVITTKQAVIKKPGLRTATYNYVIDKQDKAIRGWVKVTQIALNC
ncbi:hypothetical protein YK48G_08650 [Lentilactobacillus fungorum]|uniref:Uncharacterized protein n=1 Tax=Lentilactobacillus fungorum TaxID=2201250 RepID=A0ABQ3VY15_9LACO|nr:hypothetical protein [Lentilactobacillus fungorum]GHP13440.1 hypothetical protein YK48G_08650 [Lentilactobacillus fungorum]